MQSTTLSLAPGTAKPDAIQWTLKAGIYYCYVSGKKAFELKQGVGKWTITALGHIHEHKVALDPELAKAFAMEWFCDKANEIVAILAA